MDGFQASLNTRLNHSLQAKLSFYLALTIVIVALVAGAVSSASAFNEAHDLQDGMLRQIAALAAHKHHGRQDALETAELSPSDADEETRVTVRWLPARGSLMPPTLKLPIPVDIGDGLHTLTLDDEDVRVVVRTLADGSRVVVSQETGMRNQIARYSAFHTVTPLLLLVPLLVMMVSILVRKLLAPIVRLSAEVNARSESALHPVTTAGVPSEIRPLLDAINGLLTKVEQTVSAQRRFLADAAHELRSPLAALSLQSERLSQADMSEVARERLQTVHQGIERGRHLLEQLLALARMQSAPQISTAPVSVLALSRRVIEDAMPLAESKRIDLGMSQGDEAFLAVDETALFVAVKNLVDNAIRYSPPGSKVDLNVRLRLEGICISVCDRGPGIPQAEHSRVFDPFYRVLGTEESGSGLGLAIVKEIADHMGASVRLAPTDELSGKGLTVSFLLPVKAYPCER